MTDLTELPQADQEAIGRTLLTLLRAFNDRDATMLQSVYSDDADWVNAFGTVKRGRDEIVDYLTGLFADANFNRGELTGPPATHFKVLTPEVVLGLGTPAGQGAGSGRWRHSGPRQLLVARPATPDRWILAHRLRDVPRRQHRNHLSSLTHAS